MASLLPSIREKLKFFPKARFNFCILVLQLYFIESDFQSFLLIDKFISFACQLLLIFIIHAPIEKPFTLNSWLSQMLAETIILV